MTVEEVAAAAEARRPLVALVVNAAGSLAVVVSRVDDSATPTFETIWAPQLTTSVLDELLTTVEDGEVVGGYLARPAGSIRPGWNLPWPTACRRLARALSPRSPPGCAS